MKNFKTFFAFIAMTAIMFTSCSKDNDQILDDPNAEKGTISFGAVLNDLISDKAALKQQLDIPNCSDEAPAFVEVVLTGPTNVGSIEDPLVVSVNPNPADYDDDSVEEYFTDESADLELEPGTYQLQYFVVYDGDPDDASSNRLWVAPQAGGAMAEFVDSTLPQTIELGAGAKKYVDVEVLCFDDRLVNEYGYLFFDIENTEAIEFCVYGNFCPPSGRHFPAAYSVDVWVYEDGVMGTQIHSDLTATVVEDENGDWAASPVCMALPDTDGLDEYYVEITLLESDAYGNIEERVIRSGVVNDDEVRSLFDGENNLDYYHFREGCEGNDGPPIFQDPEDDALSYKSCLYPVNGSEALGFAYLTLSGDELYATTVWVNMEQGEAHPQGIYSYDGNGCPPAGSDQLLLALTEEGGDHPVSTGMLTTYERTFTLGQGGIISSEDLGPLDERSVVFHGMTVEGEYDSSIPVACGEFFSLDF